MSDEENAAASGTVTRLRPKKPCPICSKTSTQAFHPFCSARCANIDLNRWLTGSYVIPGADEEDDEAAIAAQTDEQS
jgi:hypothetical protein